MALRTIGVKVLADVAGYMSNLRRAGAATRDFGGELNRAAKGGHVEELTRATAGLGLGLAGVAVGAVKMAADFDKAMSGVKAATHAGSAEIAKLREAAIEAGKSSQYSATEAAEAITALSKAGVSTADVLGGGLKGALDLAAAGQIDVGEAAETAASALTQFKLQGAQVPHVADLLAAAAGKAQGSVHDMGYALNQSGLVAAQFGLSVEDTTGVLAEFASAGLIGSDAGTSFKTMLIAMANPSDITKNKMKELGISFYDSKGQFIGLSGVAQVLQDRLKGVSQETRQSALAQIFGNDAVRAASIIYADGAQGVQKWKTAVDDAGYASETARIQTDNLAGDLERLKGSIETLAIESGSGANGGLRQLVKLTEGLVDRFGALPPVVGSTITVMAGLSGAALLLGSGWLKARRASAELRAELEAMGPAGARAASGLSRVASAAGKVGAAFAALEIAGAIVNQFQSDLNPQLDALGVGLEQFARTGSMAGESSRLLGGDLGKLQGQFQILADSASKQTWARNIQSGLESIVPGLNKTDTSLANTKERVAAMDSALAGLVQGGKADQANQAFNRLASVLATGGVSMAEFRKQFPAYAGALETAAAATKDASKQTGGLSTELDGAAAEQKDFKSATDAAAAASRGQRDALSQLATFMKAETDPVFGFIDAQNALKKAQKEATAAIRDHGRNSQEAKDKTRALALAALDLQAKAGALGSTFDGHLSPALRTTLKAAGVTDAEMKILEGQFKSTKGAADKYDGKYEGKTSAPGAKQAKVDLDKAYTAANNFAGPYRANVTVTGNAKAEADLRRLSIYQQALKSGKIPVGFNGPIKGPDGKYYAEGGWTGPGPKWQKAGDVHADEYVIKKESRRKIEARVPGLLDEMNATGNVPGYAGGGRVGSWPYRTTAAMTKIPSREAVAAAVMGSFGNWPSSPGAQRGDSGVWRKIVALVAGSGIPYDFGNGYRPGDPLWHGSGRAVDFMGYNQDRLANFFLSRQSQVLELIHRSKSRDYGITRGHYNAMPTQWPLHRNHLHIAMGGGGTITEPIFGMGASGRTYSFGENYHPETVTPGYRSGGDTNVNVTIMAAVGSSPKEIGREVASVLDSYCRGGGRVNLRGSVST